MVMGFVGTFEHGKVFYKQYICSAQIKLHPYSCQYPIINYPFLYPVKVCMNLLQNCYLCPLSGPEVSLHFYNYKRGIKQCYWRIRGPSFLSLVLHSGPFSLTKVCTKYRILVIKSNNLKYNALVY